MLHAASAPVCNNGGVISTVTGAHITPVHAGINSSIVPVPPCWAVEHHLNTAGQDVLTIASWVLAVVVLGLAYRMCRKERTPFYVFMVLASMVAALAEPLYDVMFSLYFYSGPKMQSSYTVFGIPQPVWAYSGYAILYALPAMYIVHEAYHGKLTAKRLFVWAGIEFLESCVFEMVGINMGTYTYWGPHVFRVFRYPLIIGILEAGQVMTFAIASSNLRHRITAKWQSIALFAIFPFTMVGANFGAGAAEIISIHANNTSVWVVRICTLVSAGLVVALIRLNGAMIPGRGSKVDGNVGPRADAEAELTAATAPPPARQVATT